MAKVSAFLAPGLEEVECLAVVDVLRRAGVCVDLVSISEDRCVTGSHGICIVADTLLGETNFEDTDCLFLPGGMPGTENLYACGPVCELLRRFAAADIEARPVWKPLHLQPVFAKCRVFGGEVAEALFERGVCLPSGTGLKSGDFARIAACLK